jgi:hypothetical protein
MVEDTPDFKQQRLRIPPALGMPVQIRASPQKLPAWQRKRNLTQQRGG